MPGFYSGVTAGAGNLQRGNSGGFACYFGVEILKLWRLAMEVEEDVPGADQTAEEQPNSARFEATATEWGEPAVAAAPVRGRPFPPGVSGNPKGRPLGSKNRTTAFCEALLASDAKAIMASAVRGARAGKAVALRLCVERLVPVRSSRDRIVSIDVPRMEKAEDLVSAAAAVVREAASGGMTLSEARDFMHLLEIERRAIETHDLAVRVELLTSQVSQGGQPAAEEVDRRAAPEAAAGFEASLADRVRRLALAQLVHVRDPAAPASGSAVAVFDEESEGGGL